MSLIEAPGTKLNLARFTLPPRPISCRERSIWHEQSRPQQQACQRVKTVLVLDGDVLVRMPVVQFLRDCGYRVVEAANTDEAMVILQKTNVPVDVVLSEIDIPGFMNGFMFARMGSLSPTRIENPARRDAGAHSAERG